MPFASGGPLALSQPRRCIGKSQDTFVSCVGKEEKEEQKENSQQGSCQLEYTTLVSFDIRKLCIHCTSREYSVNIDYQHSTL
uniref:Uncharacterized protein n=1 Tax=Vespula pensylvanica TaxID=30213 RepID=A0A834P7X2_VESPE|nr:hypothetical protein H0235_004801 [Vespula pensylvanica]